MLCRPAHKVRCGCARIGLRAAVRAAGLCEDERTNADAGVACSPGDRTDVHGQRSASYQVGPRRICIIAVKGNGSSSTKFVFFILSINKTFQR